MRRISSPNQPASARSWVTMITVFSSERKIARRSAWSSARTIGSSAHAVHRAGSRAGRASGARIRLARCFWPPESWAGNRSRPSCGNLRQLGQFGEPAVDARSVPPQEPGDQVDVAPRREVREQAAVLGDVAQPTADLQHRLLRQRSPSMVMARCRAGPGRSSAAVASTCRIRWGR